MAHERVHRFEGRKAVYDLDASQAWRDSDDAIGCLADWAEEGEETPLPHGSDTGVVSVRMVDGRSGYAPAFFTETATYVVLPLSKNPTIH